MVLAHDIEAVARTDDIKIVQNITFDYMLLTKRTLDGLKQAGFYKPSPIQLHGIPLGKCGFDLLLEAKSGTGKTAVFSVIALEKIVINNGLQVVILAPTREIAAQIHDVLKDIGSQYEGLVVEYVIGGMPLNEDIEKFKNKKVHIVVASPGRFRNLVQEKHIDVSSVRLFVLDEADKLVDQSFLADINYIFSLLPPFKQIIMSSATYPDETKDIINKYMRNPQHVCPNSSSVLRGVQQKVSIVQYNSNIINQTKIRYKELLNIFTNKQFKQCLVFCNFQVRVSELYKLLLKDNWPAEQLFGKQEQTERLDAIKTLKEFKCRILIATDLAARGIDASNIDLVISFEPAREWTTYLHRIGRAGRYGSYGEAITILSKGQEVMEFEKIISNVMSDSWNVYHLWSNEKFESENNIENKSLSVDFNKNGIDSLICDLKKDLSTKDIDINNSSHGISEIENFDQLISSFENNHIDIDTNVTFNKIELNNVEEIMNKVLCSNNNLGYNKSIEVNNINGTIQNKFDESENNVVDGCVNNKESFEEEFNEFESTNAILQTDLMAKLGLPTAFSGKEDKNKNRSSYKNCYLKKQDQDNYKATQKSRLYSVNNQSNETSNKKKSHKPSCSKKHIEISSQPIKWDTDHYESNYIEKKPNKSISNDQYYIKWYNELKNRSKQIEYMIYVNEMSK